MAVTPEIFGPAYTYIDSHLLTVIGARVGTVMSSVRPVLMAAVTLYVVLYGWAVIRGAIQEPVMDFVTRAIKLVFVVTIGTTAAYNNYVTVPLFTDLPAWLANSVAGGSSGGAGKPFDQLLAKGVWLGEKIAASGNPLEFANHIMAALVILAAGLVAALGFAIFMIAKIALAILVIIGPIFIATLVFEPTRRFFYGWLSQAVNYLTLYALIIVIFEIVTAFTFSQFNTLKAGDPYLQGTLFIPVALLGAVFFLQVPVMAAGIAGGAAAGVKDFNPFKSDKAGAGGGGGGGGKGGGSVGKK